jgi:uncharacterized protein (DUF2062 family)
MRRRFKEHSAKLFVIKDTPQSIALGAAIGIFLGFTPLFGLKTLLAFLLAALFRVNKIAAVVTVSLHDVLFLLWPVVYRVEFDLGYWLLHEPHQWPLRLALHRVDYRVWFHWPDIAWLCHFGRAGKCSGIFVAEADAGAKAAATCRSECARPSPPQ